MDLPKKLIDSVADQNTREGNVIKYFCYDLNIALNDKVLIYKEKRLVIVTKCFIEEYNSIWEYYGCVFINAGSYADISDDYVLKSQQLVARASKYRDFLRRDSFFDCSALNIKEASDVKYLVENEPGRVLGKINDVDLKAIR